MKAKEMLLSLIQFLEVSSITRDCAIFEKLVLFLIFVYKTFALY